MVPAIPTTHTTSSAAAGNGQSDGATAAGSGAACKGDAGQQPPAPAAGVAGTSIAKRLETLRRTSGGTCEASCGGQTAPVPTAAGPPPTIRTAHPSTANPHGSHHDTGLTTPGPMQRQAAPGNTAAAEGYSNDGASTLRASRTRRSAAVTPGNAAGSATTTPAPCSNTVSTAAATTSTSSGRRTRASAAAEAAAQAGNVATTTPAPAFPTDAQTAQAAGAAGAAVPGSVASAVVHAFEPPAPAEAETAQDGPLTPVDTNIDALPTEAGLKPAAVHDDQLGSQDGILGSFDQMLQTIQSRPSPSCGSQQLHPDMMVVPLDAPRNYSLRSKRGATRGKDQGVVRGGNGGNNKRARRAAAAGNGDNDSSAMPPPPQRASGRGGKFAVHQLPVSSSDILNTLEMSQQVTRQVV